MGENTDIAWAHHTHSPWEGCTKVSPACDNCYAEVRNQRFYKGAHWGPHADRRRMSDATLRKPYKWNREAEALGERYRVFPSLCDPFDNHKSILPEWRDEHWQMIRDTPHLDHLLLTKRPQNIQKYLPEDWGDGYPNVWLGTTVENQEEADRRIPHLLSVPALVHFLSCEPIVDRISLLDVRAGPVRMNSLRGTHWNSKGETVATEQRSIGWVVAGGESGPNYRPGKIAWFRSLRDQCHSASVPFLFKQHEGKTRKEIDAKGRELDGVVWDQFPSAGRTE